MDCTQERVWTDVGRCRSAMEATLNCTLRQGSYTRVEKQIGDPRGGVTRGPQLQIDTARKLTQRKGSTDLGIFLGDVIAYQGNQGVGAQLKGVQPRHR